MHTIWALKDTLMFDANFLSFRPRKSSLCPAEDDEDVEEEADEVVPHGDKEVELAKIVLEQKDREKKLILHDIRKLSISSETSGDLHTEKEGNLWIITGGRSTLVRSRV